jgi:serine/threonine protein kinase
MDTDRNLLFGVLALQSAFIDNNQFAEVCAAWTTRKRSPLAELLRERGWISGEEQQQIERSVERHLQRHGGDVRKSLGAVADAGVRDLIRATGDPELRKSLSGLPPAAGYVLVHTLDQTLNAPTRERSRYSITRLHAEGGLGRVYVARDNDLGRDVALKEIKPEQAQHPEAWRRFLKEAQVTGQLEHPNIVPVYELGRRQEDQQPFYCMRLVRGQTLRAAIAAYHERAQTGKSDALELRRLLGAFVNVCQAVGYAHARGVVHRDLKPDNVVLGSFGEVVLLDWGLARLVDEAAAEGSLPAMRIDTQVRGDATQAGVPMGTPAYMAPEQAEGRLDLIDARTDIYGLGAMLYEILTGHPPHEGPCTAQVLQRIVSGDTPRARAAGLRVPVALDAVCARAMAKARAKRYARAPDLAEDVQRYLADEPVSVYAESWPVRAARWMRKHQAMVGSAAAGLVLALVFVATLALLIQQQKGALARQNLVLAEANAREGAAAELAQKTIEDMTSQAALEFLETQKELRPEQRQFLERALEYYQQYASTLAVAESKRARPAKAYYSMGYLQARLGLHEAARDSFAASIAEYERLAAEDRQVSQYHQGLANSHNNLGNLLVVVGKRDEAEREYRAALKEQERLAAEHPRVPQYRHELARSHNNLGILLKDLGKRDEAEREYHAALKEQKRLAAEHPSAPDFQNELAATLGNMAILRNAVNDWDAARELLEQARPHHEAALKANAQHVTYRLFYRNNLKTLSTSLLGLGDHAAAADTARKLAELVFEPIGDHYDAACFLSRSVPLAEKDPKLSEARRKELVKSYADQAMNLLRQAVAKGYKDAAHMKKDTDLDPICNREDFKRLIGELESKKK